MKNYVEKRKLGIERHLESGTLERIPVCHSGTAEPWGILLTSPSFSFFVHNMGRLLKGLDFYFCISNKGQSSQGYGFSNGHVWM